MSAKAMAPVAVIAPSSTTAPEVTAEVMVGVSLVPVMVTVTGWLTVPPWPSETVTV